MKRCAFLTMDSLDDFVCYDHLLVEPLAELGWSVDNLSWRQDGVDWSRYAVVVIRSTWDYQQNPGAFMNRLEEIDASPARLENALPLVRWNIDKAYLKALEQAGIDIVPTLWGHGSPLATALPSPPFGSDSGMVIKPRVSANADDTYRMAAGHWKRDLEKLAPRFGGRDWMLQPYMSAIAEEGEFSLFYFDGRYSHAILKTPAGGDFRVQEEHGGRLRSVSPEPGLRQAADRVMAAIEDLHERPLYVRIDLVRDASRFRLMEVELIEPSLYFNMDAESPRRFAEALERRVRPPHAGD